MGKKLRKNRTIRTFYNKNVAIIVIFTFLLGGVTFIVGGSSKIQAQEYPGAKSKENAIDFAYKSQPAVVPPIDAAAPSRFETASFGLG